MAMIDFNELSLAYEAEFQKQKNVPSRPISQIEWFASNLGEGGKWGQPRQNLHDLLTKAPKAGENLFKKSLTDKRPD